MFLKIFDTYNKKIVTIPLDRTIKLYSCGPTVYNYQHIGNIIAVLLPQLITNTILYSGGSMLWSSNVTDLGHLVDDSDDGEDKMELGAKAKGISPSELAEFFFEDFVKQLELVNIQLPQGYLNPRATNYIYEQMYIALELVKTKKAYYLSDGIYFDSLANSDLNSNFLPKSQGDSNYNDRELVNNIKNPEDFALWKFVDPSTFQKYRFKDYPKILENFDIPQEYNHLYGCPGWHTECVAMIGVVLGFGEDYKSVNFSFTNFQDKKPIIDIHTGGEDHIPLHHKNEILQSLALGVNLSQYWVHNKHLKVENQRMSKSLGNFFTVAGDKDTTGFDSIVSKGYNPLAFRLMFLEHNYQDQINFSWEKLGQSQNRLYNFYKLAGAVQSFKIIGKEINKMLRSLFQELLLDNLKTREVLELLQKTLNDQITKLNQGQELQEDIINTLIELDKTVLRLNLFPSINIDIIELANKRTKLKEQKSYQEADKVRQELLEQGFEIDDYRYGFGLWRKSEEKIK